MAHNLYFGKKTYRYKQGFPDGLAIKNLLAMQEI